MDSLESGKNLNNFSAWEVFALRDNSAAMKFLELFKFRGSFAALSLIKERSKLEHPTQLFSHFISVSRLTQFREWTNSVRAFPRFLLPSSESMRIAEEEKQNTERSKINNSHDS